MVCQAPKKKGERPTTSSQEGVCYAISCDRCANQGVAATYYGESSRTPYLRGREHLQGQTRHLEENPLYKHDVVHHLGVKGGYSMRVLRRHKAPLSRQLHEATEIELSKDKIIMNSKGEYNCARLPRITVEVGKKVLTADYRGQEQMDPDHAINQIGQWERAVRGTPLDIPQAKKRPGGSRNTYSNLDTPQHLSKRHKVNPVTAQPRAGTCQGQLTSTLDNDLGTGMAVVVPVSRGRPTTTKLDSDPGTKTLVVDTADPEVSPDLGSSKPTMLDNDPRTETLVVDPADPKVSPDLGPSKPTIFGSTDIRYRSATTVLMTGARVAHASRNDAKGRKKGPKVSVDQRKPWSGPREGQGPTGTRTPGQQPCKPVPTPSMMRPSPIQTLLCSQKGKMKFNTNKVESDCKSSRLKIVGAKLNSDPGPP